MVFRSNLFARLIVLVVAAVVHAEVASARPFVRGNAVVARAMERAVVMARGDVLEPGDFVLSGEEKSNAVQAVLDDRRVDPLVDLVLHVLAFQAGCNGRLAGT